LIDADHVRRDQMSGPTIPDVVIIIDKISEVRPNELEWSGARDGKPIDGVWRIERKGDSMRAQGIEASRAKNSSAAASGRTAAGRCRGSSGAAADRWHEAGAEHLGCSVEVAWRVGQRGQCAMSTGNCALLRM
jgi:hypothetical protein